MAEDTGHGEDEGHGLGPIIWLTVACIVGALILVALIFQKDTTSFFIALNDRFNSLFENDLFIRLRFFAGIITVALTGFATWLFFKLLEMEKEHENHVYHATDHNDQAHTHERDLHTTYVETHSINAQDTHQEVSDEERIAHEERTHVDVKEMRSAPSLDELSKMPETHHINTKEVNTPIPGSHMSVMPRDPNAINSQVKTAPPPAKIFQDRLPGESGVRGVQIGEEHPGRHQWQSVLRHATSPNESDWRLAIIEADVILDMMTYIQGFQGETLGERLKNADPGFFKNVDFARKAHWMRNQIAHQPDIKFTPREINQAIRMYEAAFNEFKYI